MVEHKQRSNFLHARARGVYKMQNETSDEDDVPLSTDSRARIMEEQSLLYRKQQQQQQDTDTEEAEMDDFLFKLSQQQQQTSRSMQRLMIIGIVLVPILATLLVQLLSTL